MNGSNKKTSGKRAVVIAAIIAGAVLLGFLVDLGWGKLEEATHPKTYSSYVRQYAYEFNVPESIIYAVIKTESGFESNAVSSSGAVGLMQIIPTTFDEITVKLGDNYEKGMMYDPKTNIRYGTYYLSYLYRHFADWDAVFAAYNAGMGTVSEWLGDPDVVNDEGKLENIPYSETRSYVNKVNSTINKYVDLYGENF